MMLQLSKKLVGVNIIQVYVHTADKSEHLVQELYEEIEGILKSIQKSDMGVVMGDFNSKIGRGLQGQCVRAFGLGERNERGDRLIQCCEEHKFIATNTLSNTHLGDYIHGQLLVIVLKKLLEIKLTMHLIMRDTETLSETLKHTPVQMSIPTTIHLLPQ